MFFDIRTFEDSGADLIPIQPNSQSQLSEWPPLHVEKKHNQADSRKAKKSRTCIWIALLLILLAGLTGNVIFLNIRILAMNNAAPSNFQSPSSFDVDQCTSQFTINAPSDPSSYPCGSCLPVLSGVSSNSHAMNAVQFCALRSIFESADSNGQSTLKTGGWVTNVNFCSWEGVSCSSDNVDTLTLSFPGVPASLPNELGSLATVKSIQLIGNGALPAGSVPSSFHNLTSLTTLHLESTAITTFPDDLFSSVNKVSNLTIVSNLNLSADFTSITGLPLQRLRIQHQFIGNPLPDITASKTLQSSLVALDLSSNGFDGPIPSAISNLNSLTELHLDGNNLDQTIPAFPANLQILTASNNPALTGSAPSDLCASKTLVQCNLSSTGLTAPSGGCGVCQF